MCDYCEKMKSIYWDGNKKKTFVQEVYIELDGTLTVSPNYGDEDTEDINVKINYCPMCGEKLN